MTQQQQQVAVNWEEIMLKHGFYFVKSCSCGGKYTKYYQHRNRPGVEIRLYPNHHAFEIRQNRRMEVKTNMVNLDQQINTRWPLTA